MGTSLLITTFSRDNLLKLTLPTVQADEVIVVNDGPPGVTEGICKYYGAKYIWTGRDGKQWRIPGFAINIAAKKATQDILIISCAEMLHLNNCCKLLADPHKHGNILTLPEGKDDNGDYLKALKIGKVTKSLYQLLPPLQVKLPFLLGIKRSIFLNIGGYDEDFLGQAWDDNDLVDRLLLYGCKYYKTSAKCVHLWHSRQLPGRDRELTGRWQYNKDLYLKRKGIIHRNKNRNWGVL